MEQVTQNEVGIKQPEKEVSLMIFFWLALLTAFVVTIVLGSFWGVSDIPLFVCVGIVVQQLMYKTQTRYFDLCVYIFLTVIAVVLTITLSLCGIMLLWPDKFPHDFGVLPVYEKPFKVIRTVLSIGVFEGLGFCVLGCLIKFFIYRIFPNEISPPAVTVEPIIDD